MSDIQPGFIHIIFNRQAGEKKRDNSIKMVRTEQRGLAEAEQKIWLPRDNKTHNHTQDKRNFTALKNNRSIYQSKASN